MSTYPYKLPELPYAYNALEPHIDEATMKVHHDKHHQGYLNKTNKDLEKYSNLHDKSAIELLKDPSVINDDSDRQFFINNAGGYVHHSIFWEIMSPNGGGEPKGELKDAINETFGSFDKFKEEFETKSLNRFGSGWAWLVLDKSGNLKVINTPNQDSPYTKGYLPIIGNDVWEHAYYLKYQNKRGDYVKAWWNVVNWDKAEERYQAGK
jgi:Fe-Mn family superoxide dismutase